MNLIKFSCACSNRFNHVEQCSLGFLFFGTFALYGHFSEQTPTKYTQIKCTLNIKRKNQIKGIEVYVKGTSNKTNVEVNTNQRLF